MFIYLLIALATTAGCLYLYFTRTFNYWRSRNVEGPTPVPIFGNLKESALRRTTMMTTLRNIYNDYPNEKIVGVYRMTSPDLLIRDPDTVRQVMIKDFDNFPDRGMIFDKEGLGANLFHADEGTWRILRNKFTPMFTSGKLKNMLHLIIDRSDHFMRFVENVTRAQPEQEVFQIVQKFTIASISACAFGINIDISTEDGVLKTLAKIDKKIFSASFALELDMMYPGILDKVGSSLFPADLKGFFYGLVKQIVTERKGQPTNRKDFMDLILELKQAKQILGGLRAETEENKPLEITDGLIAAQAFVFYAAGYETSATTMGYMLMLLALHPDIQEKVVEEINEVLKRHDDKITYDALQEMTYLERVFDETLRLFPVVDIIQRRVASDYKTPGIDVKLKTGQTILVSAGGLHNDEKYWPNPSKFDPDRFAPANSADRHPAVYLPFGIGPRNCIGMRFAKVQSRVCAARLLQQFRFEPTQHARREMRYDPNRLVLTPDGGCKLVFVPRM